MHIKIYSRVSTDKQTTSSQLEEVRRYCKRRDWHNVEEITDVASGAQSSRVGLDRLMAAVRRGKVDAVVCFKLDRLGRSLAHLAQLISEFETHKVALVCTSQGIDTTNANPAAQLQLNILCAVAQFEREVIRDRVNSGIAAARKRGVRLGRPSTLKRHEKAVAALLAEGNGVCQIARELGLPLSSAHKLVTALKQTGPHASLRIAPRDKEKSCHNWSAPNSVAGASSLSGDSSQAPHPLSAGET